MKLLAPLAALALLQLAPSTTGPAAEPNHLRFERSITLPVATAGTACAVLDATTFAHASDRAADDLRLYSTRDGHTAETPFALTENAPAPVEPERATVQNLGARSGDIDFDLVMPNRPYSEIDLDLDAADFIATAKVEASAAHTQLGTFTLFDFGSQHLSRSTVLRLQESTFDRLHVTLHPAQPDGARLTLPPSIVRGASVPPSREAQTLYTSVAETTTIRQDGQQTLADLDVAAHVPIERLSFVLDPQFRGNFIRSASMDFTVHNVVEAGLLSRPLREIYRGEISRESMRPTNLPGAVPIHEEHLSFETLAGETMIWPATAHVVIANGDDQPLPVLAVRLEMRQRRICFDAQPATAYTLRYGDPALHAPVYDYARLFNPAAPLAIAALGPEHPNAAFTPRADTRPYTERHPELLWIVLLGVVAVLGATAIGSAKHQRRSS